MYKVIVIEDRRKPYMMEFDFKEDSDSYVANRLDYFIENKCKPIVKTSKDELGMTYVRIFQFAALNRREYPRKSRQSKGVDRP